LARGDGRDGITGVSDQAEDAPRALSLHQTSRARGRG
jgi:hypothetical protein